jgi:hypothetical protein
MKICCHNNFYHYNHNVLFILCYDVSRGFRKMSFDLNLCKVQKDKYLFLILYIKYDINPI